MIEHEGVIVYLAPDGRDYVACIGDDWWRWPAEAHGWQRRARCHEAAAEPSWELEPRLAALALRLRGAVAAETR